MHSPRTLITQYVQTSTFLVILNGHVQETTSERNICARFDSKQNLCDRKYRFSCVLVKKKRKSKKKKHPKNTMANKILKEEKIDRV